MTTSWIITTTSQVSALVDTARQIGGAVKIVAVGALVPSVGEETIHVAIDPGTPLEASAPAVAGIVEAGPGDVVLVADRPADRVIAGAVAAHLCAPVLTNLIGHDDGVFTVSRFGGIAEEELTAPGPVVIVTAGGADLAEEAAGTVTSVNLQETHAARIMGEKTQPGAPADLSAAKRIVSAGRGFKEESELQLARDLAGALGAELACSRPLAEGVGWMPKDRYVGVSGAHVSPDLYVAVGISGQIQHVAGMSGSHTVVAINSDGEAPIFAEADYGIVGDLADVLPALTMALR